MCWVFYGCLQNCRIFGHSRDSHLMHGVAWHSSNIYVYHKMAKRRCCVKIHWSHGLLNAAYFKSNLEQLYQPTACPVQVMSYAHDVIPPSHLCRSTPN